jgi:parvulin-like peptidyl-prolyl isomerase
MVEEVRKATVTPLTSIRDQIESTLVAAESEKVQKEWIDRLKRDAYIERFL